MKFCTFFLHFFLFVKYFKTYLLLKWTNTIFTEGINCTGRIFKHRNIIPTQSSTIIASNSSNGVLTFSLD